MILLVNGVNLYFENADLNKKFKTPDRLRRGGPFRDHARRQHPPENEPEGTVPAGRDLLRRFEADRRRRLPFIEL